MPTGTNQLADFIAAAPLFEEGGATAVDRFDYQKNWALIRLLSLHRGDGDYVLLCELHEDITVLDSTTSPGRATFYQVKTDSSNLWTLRRLTSRKKSKIPGEHLPSILGKLCAKVLQLDKADAAFQFVTNSGFKFESADGLKPATTKPGVHLLSDLVSSKEWATLVNALALEIGDGIGGVLESRLSVAVAEIPLQMHNEATLGIVSKFLEEYASGCAIIPGVFYRALFDELRRRTVAKRPPGTLPDICRTKGVDRQAFNRMLKDAMKVAPANSAWPQVRSELQADGVPLAVRVKLDAAYKAVYVKSLNAHDSAFRRDSRLLVLHSATTIGNHAGSILEHAEGVVEAVRKMPSFGAASLTHEEAVALVMVDIYERQHDEISNADAQLEDEDV